MRSTLKFAVGFVAALAVAAPAAAHDTPEEAANKQAVLGFYAALNAADAAGTTKRDIQTIAERYLDPAYTQHAEMYKNMPGPGTDRDKLVRMFQSMPAMAGPPSQPTTEAVMAEGDRVMLLTSRTMVGPGGGVPKTTYIFNMFKVKSGKLVEHWDVSSGMGGPPPGGGAGAAPGMPGMPPGGMPPGGMPPGGMPPGDGPPMDPPARG